MREDPAGEFGFWEGGEEANPSPKLKLKKKDKKERKRRRKINDKSIRIGPQPGRSGEEWRGRQTQTTN